jgi:hypothetical protein
MAAKNERAPIEVFAPAAPEAPGPDGQRPVRRGDPAPSPPDWPPDSPRGVRAATLQRQKSEEEQLKLRSVENRHDNLTEEYRQRS